MIICTLFAAYLWCWLELRLYLTISWRNYIFWFINIINLHLLLTSKTTDSLIKLTLLNVLTSLQCQWNDWQVEFKMLTSSISQVNQYKLLNHWLRKVIFNSRWTQNADTKEIYNLYCICLYTLAIVYTNA